MSMGKYRPPPWSKEGETTLFPERTKPKVEMAAPTPTWVPSWWIVGSAEAAPVRPRVARSAVTEARATRRTAA
jgi:hypothetical protein